MCNYFYAKIADNSIGFVMSVNEWFDQRFNNSLWVVVYLNQQHIEKNSDDMKISKIVKKYILKKEQQWKEYMAVSGLEFDEISKQPKIKKAQKSKCFKKYKILNLMLYQILSQILSK